MLKDIRKKKYIRRPIKQVWDALSDPEKLSEWFSDAEFKPKEASKIEFKRVKGNKIKIITGEVLTAQEPINLAYSWVDPSIDHTTYVWWKLLDEKEDRTLVELDHSGFKGIMDILARRRYSSFWNKTFKKLETYLEKTKTEKVT